MRMSEHTHMHSHTVSLKAALCHMCIPVSRDMNKYKANCTNKQTKTEVVQVHKICDTEEKS